MKLAQSYGAQAVDMEAAAVARGAQARGVRFMAVKAISDESTFAMPSMDRFVDGRVNFAREGLRFCSGAPVALGKCDPTRQKQCERHPRHCALSWIGTSTSQRN